MSGSIGNAVVSGLMLAGLYTLSGLAWAILFRSARIFNFGTGQFIVLGAYVSFVLTNQLGLPQWLALVGSVVLMGLFGAAVQTGLLRRLLGTQAHAAGHAPFAPVILTFGIAAVIQHVLAAVFGRQPRFVENPLPTGAVHLPGGQVISAGNIFIWVLALVVFAATLGVIRFTRWGMQMRAAAELPVLASLSGIRVETVLTMTWAAVSGITALVGIAYSYGSVVSPSLADIGLRSMAPVIIGGMDSVAGVLPGSIIVALAESIAVLVFGESVRDAAVMVAVLIVLVIRPSGLFGSADVRRP